MKNIRIIAPSGSIASRLADLKSKVENIYHSFGIQVSYAQHINEVDEFFSSSITSRISDIYDAFQDPSVNFIQAATGGSNSNQLLTYLDYSLISHNPKPIIGQSDTTALLNAIYAKTGVITYHGPHFNTLLKNLNSNYTLSWLKYFLNKATDWITVEPSPSFGEKQIHDTPNDGYWVIHKGMAEGIIIGGNLPTLSLPQGTPYMPDLKDKILFIEYDGMVGEFVPEEFDRDLQALLQQPNTDKIKALVLGRFTPNANMTREKLEKILDTKRELKGIPVVANVDFGHTNPTIIFPIGGNCQLKADNDTVLKIKLF